MLIKPSLSKYNQYLKNLKKVIEKGYDYPNEALFLLTNISFIEKLYVMFVAISGSVPEINPVEEFNVIPVGKVDPLTNVYVIVESESVAVADTDTDTCSLNVPNEPLAVCHTGLAFIYKASGINPNKFEGFVTLRS